MTQWRLFEDSVTIVVISQGNVYCQGLKSIFNLIFIQFSSEAALRYEGKKTVTLQFYSTGYNEKRIIRNGSFTSNISH